MPIAATGASSSRARGSPTTAASAGRATAKPTQNGGSNRICSQSAKKVSGKATMHSEKNAGPSSGAAKL